MSFLNPNNKFERELVQIKRRPNDIKDILSTLKNKNDKIIINIKTKKNVLDILYQKKMLSNNMIYYDIRFYNNSGHCEGEPEFITREFFRISIEKMFEKYFILMPEINKYKLKDNIKDRQAKYAGFLVAFMLLNNISVTKKINNIYIAMMINPTNILTLEKKYIYSEFDKNINNNINIAGFNNFKKLEEKFTNDYSLDNKNLFHFIQSFNSQISKDFISSNSINVNDILKIIENENIEKKGQLTAIQCVNFISNYNKNNWLIDPINEEILISKKRLQEILTQCNYKTECSIIKRILTKEYARKIIFGEVQLNKIMLCKFKKEHNLPLLEQQLIFFERYLYINKDNDVVQYYIELERKCIDFYKKYSMYPDEISITNIILFNKSLQDNFLSYIDYYLYEKEISVTLIHKDVDFLESLLISTDDYTTKKQYDAKRVEKECDIYARLYYIKIFLKGDVITDIKNGLILYEKLLNDILNDNTSKKSSTSLNTSKKSSASLNTSKKSSASFNSSKKSSTSLNSSKKTPPFLNIEGNKCMNNFDPFDLNPLPEFNTIIIKDTKNTDLYYCFNKDSLLKWQEYVKNHNKEKPEYQHEKLFTNLLKQTPFTPEDEIEIERQSNNIDMILLEKNFFLYDRKFKIVIKKEIYMGESYSIIKINYHLHEDVFCTFRQIAILIPDKNNNEYNELDKKIKDIIKNSTAVSSTIPYTFHPLFKTNIKMDDWHREIAVNYFKLNLLAKGSR